VKGHRLYVRRKIMENEEIRGLMHKRACEDQFMAFIKFKFGALSLFSLFLLVAYSFLGAL